MHRINKMFSFIQGYIPVILGELQLVFRGFALRQLASVVTG
jgi:hypothetical protein